MAIALDIRGWKMGWLKPDTSFWLREDRVSFARWWRWLGKLRGPSWPRLEGWSCYAHGSRRKGRGRDESRSLGGRGCLRGGGRGGGRRGAFAHRRRHPLVDLVQPLGLLEGLDLVVGIEAHERCNRWIDEGDEGSKVTDVDVSRVVQDVQENLISNLRPVGTLQHLCDEDDG